MEKNYTLNEKKKMNPVVFFPPILILIGFVIAGALIPEQTSGVMNKMLYGLADHFGWLIILIAFITLFMGLVFIVRKYGDVRIGGEDADPEFSIPSWCAMTICGGIGTGLLFWAMGEPIYHFAAPPVGAGVEAFTRDAGIYAISQTMWNWSLIQYSIYTLPAIAWAIIVHNKKLPLSYDSLVKLVFKREIKWLATLFRVITVFAIVGSVSNSLGVGLLQISGGLEAALGIPQNAMIWLVAAIIIGLIFIISAVSGLNKGMKKLSTACMFLFFILMFYTLFAGNTEFIGKASVEAIGNMFDNIGQRTTVMNAMAEEDTWFADWTVQYYASFIAYMAVFGMFFCRMAKGHTVREFVLVNIGVPVIFNIAWIAIFGSQAIYLQYSGTMDIWEAVNTSGMQATIFQILLSLPLGKILCVVFLIAICLSFSTLADPMSSAMASVCVDGLTVEDEPPKYIKIIIGLTIVAAAYTMTVTGGVTSIKALFVLVGVLMAPAGIICLIGSFKGCSAALKEENYGCVETKDDITN